MNDPDRLIELESRLAFQDDMLRQLDAALIAQQTRIDRIEGELRQLAETLHRQSATAEATDPDPPTAPISER